MVSDELFIVVAGPLLGVTLGLAIALIVVLYSIRSNLSSVSKDLAEIKMVINSFTEIVSLFRAIGPLIMQKGMEWLVKDLRIGGSKQAEDPLPEEKIQRRNELIESSQRRKLTEAEAKELKEILEDEARIQFSEGVIGFLGFLALLGLIGLFIAALLSSAK